MYLDSKLIQPSNLPYTEQQLIQICQQIQFFIQINPCLQKYLIDLPQLNTLASMNKITSDDVSLCDVLRFFSSPLSLFNEQIRDSTRLLFDFLLLFS